MPNYKPARHFFLFLFFLIIISLLGKPFVNAQTETSIPGQPPKIGLVLGGGSAGGFAHIGVLKWLEENHIPVDYVTGTSMGGLMGGCYAMGMSPDDIEKLAESIDWNGVFNPAAPYDSLSFRRKEDSRDYPFLEGLGLRGVPSGLGIYQVDLVLSRVTLQYSLVRNFDDLPIPFKCMATDVRKGQSVVLERGSLEKALRATMSIPVVFSPVDNNGQLLVDGGVLNNLPTKEVKKMGADVVIAVNITLPSQINNEDIGSMISRTLDTVTTNNTVSSVASANIVIEPSVGELGLYKWDEIRRYVELGYQAAEKQKGKLLQYSLEKADWDRYLQSRQNRRLPEKIIPCGIEVSGAGATNKTMIEKSLQTYIGKPVDTVLLEKDLTFIMGTNLYESISYEFDRQGEEPVLAIRVKEKSSGPPFMGFRIQTTLDHDSSRLNVGARITSLNDTGPGSEIRVDLGIGTDPDLLLELYQPLYNSKWFLAPSLYAGEVENNLIGSSKPVTVYKVSNAGIRCDLGYAFNEFSEGRLSYAVGAQKTYVTMGESLDDDYDGQVQTIQLRWLFNSGDDPILPRKGLTFISSATHYLEAPDLSDVDLIENKLRWDIPVGQKDSIFISLAGGYSSSDDLPLPQQFKLGGFFRLGAYYPDELSGSNYVFDNIGYLKCIGKLISGKNVYLGVWLENGGIYEKGSDLDIKSDLSIGFISSTILGPEFIGASYGENSRAVYYAGLGYYF